MSRINELSNSQYTLACFKFLIYALIIDIVLGFIASFAIGFNNPLITPTIISIVLFIIGLILVLWSFMITPIKTLKMYISIAFILAYFVLFNLLMPRIFGSSFVVLFNL